MKSPGNDQTSASETVASKPQGMTKKQLPEIDVPDLFANVKIKNPATFLEYPKLADTIPSHYVKYIEPVYPDKHNIEDKFWTYRKKMYEITETKIK